MARPTIQASAQAALIFFALLVVGGCGDSGIFSVHKYKGQAVVSFPGDNAEERLDVRVAMMVRNDSVLVVMQFKVDSGVEVTRGGHPIGEGGCQFWSLSDFSCSDNSARIVVKGGELRMDMASGLPGKFEARLKRDRSPFGNPTF